eukprot:TRINITY_DN91319_c0_g1_i1.p1 TRINITY_DN91319_c0_g1~~TRINITY_DN91319_c0_g1_i1.p1  ORF type:complete len:110 (-),score=1.16 TRINITY_DN91319_c0_g1_i1:1-330(-)
MSRKMIQNYFLYICTERKNGLNDPLFLQLQNFGLVQDFAANRIKFTFSNETDLINLIMEKNIYQYKNSSVDYYQKTFLQNSSVVTSFEIFLNLLPPEKFLRSRKQNTQL